MTGGSFEKLSERQRIYLRHVFQHRTSDEIAHLEGVSARAVDKQLDATVHHAAARKHRRTTRGHGRDL